MADDTMTDQEMREDEADAKDFPRYYDLDGMPIRWLAEDRGPEILRPTGWVEYDALDRLAFEGDRVDEAEFRDLVREEMEEFRREGGSLPAQDLPPGAPVNLP